MIPKTSDRTVYIEKVKDNPPKTSNSQRKYAVIIYDKISFLKYRLVKKKTCVIINNDQNISLSSI